MSAKNYEIEVAGLSGKVYIAKKTTIYLLNLNR